MLYVRGNEVWTGKASKTSNSLSILLQWFRFWKENNKIGMTNEKAKWQGERTHSQNLWGIE